MKMHVSEKNSNEQPEIVVRGYNTKEYGPMGQLAALRAEFDEFKRASTEEKHVLISERDAMAQKVDILTEQVKEASMLGEWMLEVKPNDEESKESEETVQSTMETDSDPVESNEALAMSISKLVTDLSGAKFVVDIIAGQFDNDGYIKALLPGDGSYETRAVMPSTKEFVVACDAVKNQFENGAKQVASSVTNQFDEDGYIKAMLPGEEADENKMPAFPTTKELTDACDTVKSDFEVGAQRVLVSVADKFDENGYMKCCLQD